MKKKPIPPAADSDTQILQLSRVQTGRREHTQKKVVISMNGTAASGAYAVATASDYIMATDSTLTGSIGVFSVSMGFGDAAAEFGVHRDGVHTHEMADAFSTFAPRSAEVMQLRQLGIDHSYEVLLDQVCQSRRLPRSRYKEFAEGRVFLAADAKQLRLIDEIGSFNDAVVKAEELCGLKEDETEILYMQSSPQRSTLTLLQQLFLKFSQLCLPEEMLDGELQYFLRLNCGFGRLPGSFLSGEKLALSPLVSPAL